MKNRILTIVALLCWSSFAQSEPAHDFSPIAKRGQQALKEAQYDRARDIFDAGLSRARHVEDQEWLAKFLFYRANVDLVQASKETEHNRALARRAARRYQQVLELRPTSGSAMVNLARAMTLQGKREQADEWYRRAIALDDNKQALYRKQYAGFLDAERPAAAATQRRQIIAQMPTNSKVHRQLIQTYRDPEYADELIEYLNEQIAAGEVLRAERGAWAAIDNPQWPTERKAELMTIVANAMAQQQVVPTGFADSKAAAQLRATAERFPPLSACVDELMLAMDPATHDTDFTWWTANEERSQALGGLLRANANYFKQVNQPARAEALYREAVELRGGGDPAAVRDLAEFYSERGDINKINQMSREYEFQLFEGKGQAYRAGDIQAIYEYHRTLGSIYAYQATRGGSWGSTTEFGTAAYQLQQAYDTARRSADIVPDPQLINYLAQSYEATRSKEDATQLRLEAAEMYQRHENPAAASKVLTPIKVQELSPAVRTRYERLRAPAESLQLSPKVESQIIDRQREVGNQR